MTFSSFIRTSSSITCNTTFTSVLRIVSRTPSMPSCVMLPCTFPVLTYFNSLTEVLFPSFTRCSNFSHVEDVIPFCSISTNRMYILSEYNTFTALKDFFELNPVTRSIYEETTGNEISIFLKYFASSMPRTPVFMYRPLSCEDNCWVERSTLIPCYVLSR